MSASSFEVSLASKARVHFWSGLTEPSSLSLIASSSNLSSFHALYQPRAIAPSSDSGKKLASLRSLGDPPVSSASKSA